MNINDIEKVIELKELLRIALSKHKALMSLTKPKGGKFGLDSRAYITLGGDEYGNHSICKIEVKVIDSPDIISECRKMQSKAWGVVVGIRADLRSLGVNLDEVKNEPTNQQ